LPTICILGQAPYTRIISPKAPLIIIVRLRQPGRVVKREFEKYAQYCLAGRL
jgi:hypothetical protein